MLCLHFLFFKKSAPRNEHEDIWDDTLLIKAYEESIRLQKEEVAKQVAMKTNKIQKTEEEEEESGSSSTGSSSEEFKAGDFVRSTFADDGVDYEAEVLSVNENGNCLIRYIGYGNEERVAMENLVASWGPEAREEQRILAEVDQQGSSEKESHHEELHKFVVDKTQGFQTSLPIPPMVNFTHVVNNSIMMSTAYFFHSLQCHLRCLTTLATQSTCQQCSCRGT